MQYFSCKVAKHKKNIYDKKDSIPLVEQKNTADDVGKTESKKESVL